MKLCAKNKPMQPAGKSWAKFVTALLALVCASLVTGAQGGTVQVLNTDDTGPDAPVTGSLRAALAAAADGDIIDATGIAGTITLMPGAISSAELVVTQNVTIRGPGPANLTVDASHLSRVFHITAGHTVTIEGLSIINGDASGAGSAILGGGIFNDHSVLTVNDCIISGNSAGNGGGIFSDGSGTGSAMLTVVNCIFSANSALQSGGGIFNNGYNSGEPGSASLVVVSSTFSGNTAFSTGGGIQNLGESDTNPNTTTFKAANSTFSGNSTSGAQSDGGAIFNRGATVDITSCTLSGNSAPAGGGIISSGKLKIGNTIFRAGSPGENIRSGFLPSDTVVSGGFNLSSDDGGGYLTSASDQINIDPKLGPLQNNGGPTPTHLPLAGSPAIDQGSSDALAVFGITTDQRGSPRTVDDLNIANAFLGDGTDIGAVEAAAPNHAPVAKCKSVTVLAGPGGTADASIDDGSFDPDGETINIVQEPPGPYAIGTQPVTLTVTDSHGESSSCTATVTVVGVADLSISKAVISGQAKPGQLLIYTIVVANLGPNAASGLVVNDSVPQGTTFAAASPAPSSAPPVGAGGVVVWNVGNLASGASVTLKLTVKVSIKGNDLIVNTATVTSSNSDPNPANNTATLTSKRNTK